MFPSTNSINKPLPVVGSVGFVGSVVSPVVTFTIHDALKLLPSVVVAVIVACPAFTPVSLPVESTVTTEESLEIQVTFLLAALSGVIVGDNLMHMRVYHYYNNRCICQ